jgi:outer membrane protein OmpA-like peptidoglycan-associated protein
MFRIFTICCFLTFCSFLSAQTNLSVIKNKGIPANAAITNIFIGDDNQIIIADKSDLYRILGSSQAVKITLPPNTTSLLQFKGGNSEVFIDLPWINSLLNDYFQGDDEISTMALHKEDGSLWIGTLNSGLFQLNLSEKKLIQHFSAKNGKLRSDKINIIRFDDANKIWVATDLGIFTGKSGKYEIIEKDFAFQDISIEGKSVWILGDNMVGPLNSKREWLPILVPEESIDGDLRAIGLDAEGNAWLASEIISQYLVEQDSFVLYGPEKDFTSQFSTLIKTDLEGRVWIGTEDKGMYVIQEKEMLAVGIQVVNPISCNSRKWDGALQVKVNGGVGPFKYKWSADTIKGSSPIGLGPGTYRVTVSSEDGVTQSAEVTLSDTRLKVEAKALTATSAPGNADGQAKVTVSGGTPPYQVSWDNGRTGNATGGLSGGNHVVTVVDSKNCFGVGAFEVNENQMAIGVKLDIVTAPDCLNPKGGVLQLVYKGGKPPYQFNWSVPADNSATISGLIGGIYAVTISDSEGLSAKAAIELPSPILMKATGTPLKVASGLGNDGSALVKVENAIGAVTYLWDNGQKDSVATNLSAGFHRVTLTDAKGCTLVHQVEVPEELVAVMGEVEEEKGLSCPDLADAVLKVVPKGGKAPFVFNWSTGSKEQSIKNVPAGVYSVTLTDEKLQSIVLKKEVKGPDPLDLILQIIKPASTNNADGVAKILAAGGNGGYKITWDKGEVKEEISNLADGDYDFTLVDAKGCKLEKSLRMSEIILPLSLNMKVLKEVSCADFENGSLEAFVEGGKPPYKYNWSVAGKVNATLENVKAGSYAVTITDKLGETKFQTIELKNPPAIVVNVEIISQATVNNKDGVATASVTGGIGAYKKVWSTGETGDSSFLLGPGYQKLTVTDDQACIVNKPFVITEDIKDFNANILVVNALKCAGDKNGSATLNINGGKPPYTVKWNLSELTGTELINLKKGKYIASITDSQGKSVSTSLELIEPEEIKGQISVVQIPDLDSLNGKVTITVSGGTAPYSILWDNGEMGENANALSGGSHKVTVKDTNQCEIITSFELEELVPELILMVKTENEISCFGDKNGALSLDLVGGKKPFSIKWSNGSTNPNISSLSPGKYSVTVTDSKNKSVTAEKVLFEPAKLEVNTTFIRGASDEKGQNGKSSLLINGGSFPFVILWDNGNNQMFAQNLSAGYHSVTVTDIRGCVDTSAATIPIRLIPGLARDSFKAEQIIQIEKLVFQADSISIPPGVEELLQEVLQFLKDYPTLNVEFGGHTNNVASDNYADDISLKRARSVANFFIRNGIPESRVAAFGYGKKNPLVSNDTPEGRKKNQRVELKILNGQ